MTFMRIPRGQTPCLQSGEHPLEVLLTDGRVHRAGCYYYGCACAHGAYDIYACVYYGFPPRYCDGGARGNGGGDLDDGALPGACAYVRDAYAPCVVAPRCDVGVQQGPCGEYPSGDVPHVGCACCGACVPSPCGDAWQNASCQDDQGAGAS